MKSNPGLAGVCPAAAGAAPAPRAHNAVIIWEIQDWDCIFCIIYHVAISNKVVLTLQHVSLLPPLPFPWWEG